jgi:glutathione S-transferase
MVSHILLRELNIPFKSVELKAGPNGYEAADGSFTNAEYRDIHPSGYVPAMSVDGVAITENPAILRYIADQAPERKLLGSGPLQPYKVEEWLAWLSGNLHGSGFGMLWRPGRFTNDAGMYDAISKKGAERVVECYGRIEESIVGPLVLGEQLSVVDVYLHTFWRWGKGTGFDMERFPKYQELAKRVEAMDTVKAVMQNENQPLNF